MITLNNKAWCYRNSVLHLKEHTITGHRSGRWQEDSVFNVVFQKKSEIRNPGWIVLALTTLSQMSNFKIFILKQCHKSVRNHSKLFFLDVSPMDSDHFWDVSYWSGQQSRSGIELTDWASCLLVMLHLFLSVPISNPHGNQQEWIRQ